jgi:hypothetical protein
MDKLYSVSDLEGKYFVFDFFLNVPEIGEDFGHAYTINKVVKGDLEDVWHPQGSENNVPDLDMRVMNEQDDLNAIDFLIENNIKEIFAIKLEQDQYEIPEIKQDGKDHTYVIMLMSNILWKGNVSSEGMNSQDMYKPLTSERHKLLELSGIKVNAIDPKDYGLKLEFTELLPIDD